MHTLITSFAALSTFPFIASASSSASPFDPCPIQCSKANNDPTKWTHLYGVPALEKCQEPVLFDTAIFAPVDDPEKQITLRSCTASGANTTQEMEYSPAPFTFGSPVHRRQLNASEILNGTNSNGTSNYVKLAIPPKGCNANAEARSEVATAIQKLRDYLRGEVNCQSTTMLAHFRGAVVGLYVGAAVLNADADAVVNVLIEAIGNTGEVSALSSELCRENTPASWTVGVYADFRGNISATQAALGRWVQGNCLTDYETKDNGTPAEITFIRRTAFSQAPALLSGLEQVSEPISQPKLRVRSDLAPRDTCKYLKIEKGDSCWSLAQECGVTEAQLFSYNPSKRFCNELQPDDYVCCSMGELPDFTPQPNADGSCATYQIVDKDVCYDIAKKNRLTTTQIDGFNTKTWGWAGCGQIQPGQKICLSTGSPPMPAPVENAICGPRVPGTLRPSDGKDLKDLNPCPLNVCCNVHGQCGLTNDFCVESPADTGAPGTSKPGKNGCIASCGMKITNNDSPPATFRKIAYFEAWNGDRDCLHMDITDIDTSKYTHVHFAFPDITPDFKPDVSKLQKQFDKLKNLTGIKRIVSFGGWAFSTEASTFNIFRSGVTDANRVTLANNIAAFVINNGLDGVDFDWEYPSAPDIPGIPAGEVAAGKQYLDFLKLMKRRLQKYEVAIAAPASYWYLKGMPIKEISEVVDYFVYMTYDLHGQWDYGNKWATEGCKEGNCLRSHINSTETYTSLAMVTKAGVKSSKVVVGIASYGRSFMMKSSGCAGPDCEFTGSSTKSNAAPGKCTKTNGYISNAEIRDIIIEGANDRSGLNLKRWYDADSDSDMIVYNDVQWVAWMNDPTKARRTDYYKSLNFGGTSDWAVDLDKDYGPSKVGEGDIDSPKNEEGGGPQCDNSGSYDTLDKISADTGLDPLCAQLYALYVLQKTLDGSIDKYYDVDNGYDGKFSSYTKYMKKGMPESLRQWTHWSFGEGQKYFDCKFTKDRKEVWKGACPLPRSVRGNANVGVWIIEMTLRDKDGFFKALGEATGILEDWIKFDTYKENTVCNPTPCVVSLNLTVTGMPMLKDKYDIPDPKDIVEQAIGNTGNLAVAISARAMDISLGQWVGSVADVVTSLAVPVFMVQNAVEGMEDAKELGEKAEKEEAKNQLILILSLVFMIVPFLGEVAAIAAGLIQVARLIAIAGIAGNAALGIQDIVENPEMAPLAILGMLTGGRLKSPKEFTDAAAFRRAMSGENIASLGSNFAKQDAMIQKIVRSCSR
ncbi:glycoside hydrolase [Ophiobolus disseminans]|uniref:chitinase n=1 Tax=Ophiobolus disseminans TaxID=1469910 RepID=A0A6A7A0L3_9PLEO|nr:glycoside hydrolase [Ophiobolus disseminans]